MLMKSPGLAAIERKVSSADSTSSPFPLSCWPSVGVMRAHHRFAGCWEKVSVQVQNPSVWFRDRGTKFSSLGRMKVTQAHTPACAWSRHRAVSNTESVWTCGYVTAHMHKACVLSTISQQAFFPLIHPRLHPLHTYRTCLSVSYLLKYFIVF